MLWSWIWPRRAWLGRNGFGSDCCLVQHCLPEGVRSEIDRCCRRATAPAPATGLGIDLRSKKPEIRKAFRQHSERLLISESGSRSSGVGTRSKQNHTPRSCRRKAWMQTIVCVQELIRTDYGLGSDASDGGCRQPLASHPVETLSVPPVGAENPVPLPQSHARPCSQRHLPHPRAG